MKRKYFSALLMGALTIASVSTFTSCKDYDDDIDNLQSQIDKAGLQSDIDALKTQLQDAASTASAAKTTAESALAKANAAAVKADVEKAIQKVEVTANKAATDVATAISNAANAQTTADTRLYNEIGIDKMAQDKIAYYFEQSKKYLDAVNVPAERKEELQKYAQKMMKRQY